MRNRSFKTVLAGAIAATVAFTAVPAQIVFASNADAREYKAEARDSSPYFVYRTAPDVFIRQCNVNIWGHSINC